LCIAQSDVIPNAREARVRACPEANAEGNLLLAAEGKAAQASQDSTRLCSHKFVNHTQVLRNMAL